LAAVIWKSARLAVHRAARVDPAIGEAADEAIRDTTAADESRRLESEAVDTSIGHGVHIECLSVDDVAAGECPRAPGGHHCAEGALTERASGHRGVQAAELISIAWKRTVPNLGTGSFNSDQP